MHSVNHHEAFEGKRRNTKYNHMLHACMHAGFCMAPLGTLSLWRQTQGTSGNPVVEGTFELSQGTTVGATEYCVFRENNFLAFQQDDHQSLVFLVENPEMVICFLKKQCSMCALHPSAHGK